MLRNQWLATSFVLICVSNAVTAEIPASIVVPKGPNSRYAPRVADWLWTSPNLAGYVPDDVREEIETDIRILESLRDQKGLASKEFDRRELEIASKLSRRFAIRHLAAEGQIVDCDKRAKDRNKIAVVIDPEFAAPSQATILRAVQLFISVGTNLEVIQSAIDESIPAPTPQPPKFEMEDGKPVLDRYGNPKFDNEYQFMRSYRVLPPSAAHVRAQLLSAMPGEEDDPGLLVVSEYHDNVWWGGGYFGFFYDEAFRLKRELPARGYLYIRLNQDKMKDDVPHHDDPAFWAGKVAHEVLHNFGYWHPVYADPEERDTHNPAKKKAFIVAYEQAVTDAAGKILTDK